MPITITHIIKETDGITKEEIHFTVPDVRYEYSGSSEIQMSLKDAHLFLSKLSEKLSSIPF